MKIVPLIKGGDGVPRRISDDMIAQICDENEHSVLKEVTLNE